VINYYEYSLTSLNNVAFVLFSDKNSRTELLLVITGVALLENTYVNLVFMFRDVCVTNSTM